MHKVIIGDNLEVLDKGIGLDESYKMVYLDPPYNTLTNKSYEDKVDGNEWARNMHTVLKSVKSYLREDGVLFISIDDIS